MKFETLDELVQKRKGYKYLNKDNTSPYQNFKYNFEKEKIFRTEVDTDLNTNCGKGWNLATLNWILKDCSDLFNSNIIEFNIPLKAKIIVLNNSEGKFRTSTIEYVKTHNPLDLFPKIKEIQDKLKNYKPNNPITATVMPPINKIKKIMDQVRDPVWNQVRDPVWNQVRDQVWNQVRDQVWNQVWNPIRDQVWIISYFTIKEFMDLDYEHPIFELIRLGVIVINYKNKYMIFGKNGKYLGDINK